MKKIELHIHTIASKDSLLTKWFIVIMCKIKKIDCLAITDHNEIWYAKKYQEYFKKRNIDIIVGEEIFTADGEIIGLFLNEKIEPGLTAKATVQLIKKQGGLVYIPHPHDLKRNKTVINNKALKEIVEEVDFIEFHNGRNSSEDTSKKQYDIACELSLRKIVGSDAHTFYELGRNYCLVDSYEKEKIISNIENAEFIKKKCIKTAHFNTKIAKTLKMIVKGDINGIVRVIKRKVKNRK